MSMADLRLLGSKEVVVEDENRDARLPVAGELAEHYAGFVQFADLAHFPNVVSVPAQVPRMLVRNAVPLW